GTMRCCTGTRMGGFGLSWISSSFFLAGEFGFVSSKKDWRADRKCRFRSDTLVFCGLVAQLVGLFCNRGQAGGVEDRVGGWQKEKWARGGFGGMKAKAEGS